MINLPRIQAIVHLTSPPPDNQELRDTGLPSAQSWMIDYDYARHFAHDHSLYLPRTRINTRLYHTLASAVPPSVFVNQHATTSAIVADRHVGESLLHLRFQNSQSDSAERSRIIIVSSTRQTSARAVTKSRAAPLAALPCHYPAIHRSDRLLSVIYYRARFQWSASSTTSSRINYPGEYSTA